MRNTTAFLIAALFTAGTIIAADAPAKKKRGPRKPAPLPENVEKRPVII